MCNDGQFLFLHDLKKMWNEYYQASKTMSLNFGIYIFHIKCLVERICMCQFTPEHTPFGGLLIVQLSRL